MEEGDFPAFQSELLPQDFLDQWMQDAFSETPQEFPSETIPPEPEPLPVIDTSPTVQKISVSRIRKDIPFDRIDFTPREDLVELERVTILQLASYRKHIKQRITESIQKQMFGGDSLIVVRLINYKKDPISFYDYDLFNDHVLYPTQSRTIELPLSRLVPVESNDRYWKLELNAMARQKILEPVVLTGSSKRKSRYIAPTSTINVAKSTIHYLMNNPMVYLFSVEDIYRSQLLIKNIAPRPLNLLERATIQPDYNVYTTLGYSYDVHISDPEEIESTKDSYISSVTNTINIDSEYNINPSIEMFQFFYGMKLPIHVRLYSYVPERKIGETPRRTTRYRNGLTRFWNDENTDLNITLESLLSVVNYNNLAYFIFDPSIIQLKTTGQLQLYLSNELKEDPSIVYCKFTQLRSALEEHKKIVKERRKRYPEPIRYNQKFLTGAPQKLFGFSFTLENIQSEKEHSIEAEHIVNNIDKSLSIVLEEYKTRTIRKRSKDFVIFETIENYVEEEESSGTGPKKRRVPIEEQLSESPERTILESRELLLGQEGKEEEEFPTYKTSSTSEFDPNSFLTLEQEEELLSTVPPEEVPPEPLPTVDINLAEHAKTVLDTESRQDDVLSKELMESMEKRRGKRVGVDLSGVRNLSGKIAVRLVNYNTTTISLYDHAFFLGRNVLPAHLYEGQIPVYYFRPVKENDAYWKLELRCIEREGRTEESEDFYERRRFEVYMMSNKRPTLPSDIPARQTTVKILVIRSY